MEDWDQMTPPHDNNKPDKKGLVGLSGAPTLHQTKIKSFLHPPQQSEKSEKSENQKKSEKLSTESTKPIDLGHKSSKISLFQPARADH